MSSGIDLVAQMVKNMPAKKETQVRSLDQENPLEEGMATQSSILALRISRTKVPEGHSITKCQTQLSNSPPPTHTRY